MSGDEEMSDGAVAIGGIRLYRDGNHTVVAVKFRGREVEVIRQICDDNFVAQVVTAWGLANAVLPTQPFNDKAGL